MKYSSPRSDEWYTPKWIIDSILEAGCKFDLDPCAPLVKPFVIAPKSYDKTENGLLKQWHGNVWLNPPYSYPLVTQFVSKLSRHKQGIALLFNRMDTALWHEVIFPTADAMLIMRGRVRFIDCGLREQGGATCGSVLVAWGKDNASCLKKLGITGKFIEL